MKNSIALYRVSTYRQSIEGHSLDAQEERAKEASEFLDTKIIKEWRIDTSSKRGKNLGRKDLKEALTFCRKNNVDYFIIDEVDRFMRSIEEYYWYKVEFKKLGVKLAFASQPELGDEDQFARLRELLAIYEAESSNTDRSKKTVDKMKARYSQGYYLSHPHAGYIKSEIAGLHIKDPERFDLLQRGSRLIIFDQYTPEQAVKWMNNEGYKTLGGKSLDVSHYIEFISDRYYCGKIDIKKDGPLSTVQNIDGLHEPMFNSSEHKRLVDVINKRNPKIRLKHNPEYPLANLIKHLECIEQKTYSKFSGFPKDRGSRNGKKRPKAPTYRCRSCKKSFIRSRLNDGVDDYMSDLVFLPDQATFKKALMKVWRNQRGSVVQRISALEANKQSVEADSRKTAQEYTKEPEGAAKNALRLLLEDYEIKLTAIKKDIEDTRDIDLESDKFVKFAIDFTENIKEKWWSISHDERKGGEQILFNGEFYVDSSAKVHTPNLSSIYRLGTNKKDPEGSNFNNMVELLGIAPRSEGLSC